MNSLTSARQALGAALRGYRLDRGLTQEALAMKSGLQPSYISDVERGARNPSFESLLKLLAALGLSWVEFGEKMDASLASMGEKG